MAVQMIGPDAPAADFWRRIRVLGARQQLERLSRELLCRAEGSDPAARDHGDVKARLLLLTAGIEPDRWWDAYWLAHRAGSVYAATSEVLHSRRAFGDVPEVLVREWEDVVAELSAAVPPARRDP